MLGRVVHFVGWPRGAQKYSRPSLQPPLAFGHASQESRRFYTRNPASVVVPTNPPSLGEAAASFVNGALGLAVIARAKGPASQGIVLPGLSLFAARSESRRSSWGPVSAVDAAVAAQRERQLPVPMGIATREAEVRGLDYFGAVLNRAASSASA